VETTIWFDQNLRAQWPRPLADDWHRLYPQLFDDHDLRITRHQPQGHFYEWLAAIHIFHSSGALSLVEKYLFEGAHPRKRRIVRGLFTEPEIEFLKSLPNQPPDLLVYSKKAKRYWFAEVKGPTDRIRPVQRSTQEAIKVKLGVDTDIIHARRVTSGRTRVSGLLRQGRRLSRVR